MKILPFALANHSPHGLGQKKAPAVPQDVNGRGFLGPATVAQPAGPAQDHTPISTSPKESPDRSRGKLGGA
jgi:hypothetical protein